MAQGVKIDPPVSVPLTAEVELIVCEVQPGTLRVYMQAANDEVFHADTVDLKSQHSRSRFAKAVAAARADVTADEVNKKLLNISTNLPTLLAAISTAPIPKPVDVAALWEQAKELAEAPDILDRVCAVVERLGVVNERKNTALIYLSATARLLDKPVNVVVKGVSASGKSYLMGKVIEMLPDTAYMSFTGTSAKFLAHSDRDLRHKIVVLYEAGGLTEGEGAYIMRSLLSEGRVQFGTVHKDANGSLAALEVSKEGPTAMFTSTTAINLDPELETRTLTLATSDAPEQSRAINQATAAKYSDHTPEPVDKTVFHALQAWLEAGGVREVYIPYAGYLAATVPCLATRVRRDFSTMLNLVSASAILYQAQRKRTASGKIVATVDDYRNVYGPLADVFTAAQTNGLTTEVREVVDAVAQLTVSKPDGVSLTDLRKCINRDKSSVSRRCASAADKGYIVNNEWRKGHAAQYIIADVPDSASTALPTPERVAEALACESDAALEGVA